MTVPRFHEYKSFKIETRWARSSLRFMQSPMAGVPLDSLAQNMNLRWPFHCDRKTAEDYIGYTFSELKALPEFSGKPEMIEFLVEIMEETLAFDQSSEMMQDRAAKTAADENPILKNLEKMGVPLDYPLPLVALSLDSREYCRLEGLETLQDFVAFAQRVSEKAVVLGDLRTFLNAIAHRDSEALGVFLPIRKGALGTHLFEAVVLCIRSFDPKVVEVLLGKTRADVSTQIAIESISGMVAAYVEFYAAQLADLQKQLDEGATLAHALAVMHDSSMEHCVARFIKPYVEEHYVETPSTTLPPEEVDVPAQPRASFLKRFFLPFGAGRRSR